MISLSRQSLGLIAMLFGLYHSFLGLVSIGEYSDPSLVAVAILIYLGSLFWVIVEKRGIKMRLTTAIAVVSLTTVVSYLVFSSLEGIRQSSYTTWHIAAISTVLSIITIRQYPLLAWLGFAALLFQTLLWGGADVVFNSGLIGGVVLISVSQAASWAIISSAKSAEEFKLKSLEIDAAIEVAGAAREARKERLEQTLSRALPLLASILSKKGVLTESEKQSAGLLEAELRDRIRARNLLNEDVISATRSARARGVEVQLLDDGGLDELSARDRAPYLIEITTRLSTITSGKVVIRASQGDGWRVTMAAIRKDTDRPDLFIRI
jgi:hypothetical protein